MAKTAEESSSSLVAISDVLAKAYISVGRSEVVVEEARSMLKETNDKIESLAKDMRKVCTSIEWMKWILTIGFSGLSLAAIILKLLSP